MIQFLNMGSINKMKIISLEFESKKDRDTFIKEHSNKIKYYRMYIKGGRYFIEFGQDK